MSGAPGKRSVGAQARAERTPWERPTLQPAFVAWRRDGALMPCRILLPGAGRGGEPLALAQDGFDVTVVDPDPSAVAVQRVRLSAAGFPANAHEADLLGWAPDAPFDAIYEPAFPYASSPATWSAYVACLHGWLRPGGQLFLSGQPQAPHQAPIADFSPPAMRTLFAAGWDWPLAPPEAALGGHARVEAPIILSRAAGMLGLPPGLA